MIPKHKGHCSVPLVLFPALLPVFFVPFFGLAFLFFPRADAARLLALLALGGKRLLRFGAMPACSTARRAARWRRLGLSGRCVRSPACTGGLNRSHRQFCSRNAYTSQSFGSAPNTVRLASYQPSPSRS